MNHKISLKVKQIIYKLASFLEVDNFIIYGGTVVDLLSKREVNDYDIAIKYHNKKQIKNLKRTLKRKGFEIVEPWREYIIYKNKKVILVYAKNKDYFLDIAFLRDSYLLGLYDIESPYITYPEIKVIDEYGGLRNIKRKKINLIRRIDSENPYLLLGRLIYLCSKYNISLSYSKHKTLLFRLKERCEDFKSKKEYFGTQIIPSFYSHIFKALIKSKDRLKLTNTLINYNLFKKIFPSLDESLIKISKNKKLERKFILVKNKKALISFLSSILKDSLKRDFLKEINKLKIRKWEDTPQ